MNRAELAKFRTLLERRQQELMGFMNGRENIAIDSNADMLDQIQAAGERDLAIRNLERESLRLREAAAAIARLDAGTYGVCLNCEEEIGLKRLTALPWAATCLQCQEIRERERPKTAAESEVAAAA